jgi:hypothetical protein
LKKKEEEKLKNIIMIMKLLLLKFLQMIKRKIPLFPTNPQKKLIEQLDLLNP